METKITRKALLYSNLVFCLVILAMVIYPKLSKSEEVRVTRDYSSEYKFTNPILDYENIRMEKASLFSDEIKSKVEDLRESLGLTFASVYYRDLDNGQWIGINEKEHFTTASLIKLPILISFFRQAERDQDLIDKVVTITPEDTQTDIIQDIKPEKVLEVGQSYALSEVARRMIQESDNIAMEVLLRNIEEKYRTGVFEAIGVAYNVEDRDIMVRVKDYAGFFRVLFNASYLSRENSEEALEVLSKTTYGKGLVAGVPRDIIVAHKFGERSRYDNGQLISRQLHDCGIIYYPQKPYILCVMTRGNNYDDQATFIRGVSKLFYTEVERSL